jgi:hypothetical protein
MTKEHVFPAWMAPLFPDVPDADHVRRFEELDGSQEEKNEWSRPPFTWTVRDVCATCNNGWMADLEGKAKPILTPLVQDQARSLTLPDMMAIATWATKTVLSTAERSQPSTESSIEIITPYWRLAIWLSRFLVTKYQVTLPSQARPAAVVC